MDFVLKWLDYIGFYGPEILFVTTAILLRQKHSLLTIYGLGFAASVITNYILKGLISQPRPSDETHLFNLEKMYRKTVGFDKYGMPSGHAQAVFFTMVYTFLCLPTISLPVALFYVVISLFTAYQRINYNHHTAGQVFVGAIVGILLAYLTYEYYVRLHSHNK